MSLHLKLLDIDHPLTFEESKLRKIEAHALIYLSKISHPSNPKRVKESIVIASGTEGISVTVISLFEFFLKNFITLIYFSQSQ